MPDITSDRTARDGTEAAHVESTALVTFADNVTAIVEAGGISASGRLEAEFWKIVRDHVPSVLAILSALFVAARILSVADYNTETAYGIVLAEGTATALFGALLTVIGLIVAGMTFVCFGMYLSIPLSVTDANGVVTYPEREKRRLYSAFGLTTAIVSIFIGPFSLVALTVALLVLYFVMAYGIVPMWYFLRKGPTDEEVRELIRSQDPDTMSQMNAKRLRNESSAKRWLTVSVLAAAFYVASFTTGGPTWIPAEELQIAHSRPIVAYVLSESNQRFEVLTYNRRAIEYIAASSVVSRTVCNDKSVAPAFQSLPELLDSGPGYPNCPNQ